MKYRPGQSGNPNGRPPGSGKVAHYRQLLHAHADDLIKQVIAQALAGEPAALKMCVDRLISAYRLESMPIELALPPGGKLVAMGQAV